MAQPSFHFASYVFVISGGIVDGSFSPASMRIAPPATGTSFTFANYPSELPATGGSCEARKLSSLVIADCFMGGDSESVVSCLGPSPGFSAPAAVGGYSF